MNEDTQELKEKAHSVRMVESYKYQDSKRGFSIPQAKKRSSAKACLQHLEIIEKNDR